MNKSALILTIFLFSCASEVPESTNPIDRLSLINNTYNGTMRKAISEDPKRYLEITSNLIEVSPNNPLFLLHHAKALLINQQPEEALAYLETHINQIQTLNYIDSDSLLINQLSRAEYDKLKKLISTISVNDNLLISFKMEEKGLNAEGLAFNKKNGSMFIGSIRKGQIVEVDSTGVMHEFITSHQDDITNILGLEVARNGESIWACGEQWDELSGSNKSGIFHFEIPTGQLLNSYFPNDTLSHEFNDLTAFENGKLYVTDSKSGGLYTIEDGSLKMAIPTNELGLTNGITKSDDQRFLFIADMFFGIMRYDTECKDKVWLDMPKNTTLSFIDGLTYYNNGLIAHQFMLNAVNYYKLDARSISKKEIIANYHPLLKDHTTGDIWNNEYYFIANSDIDITNRYGIDVSVDSLSQTVILKHKID